LSAALRDTPAGIAPDLIERTAHGGSETTSGMPRESLDVPEDLPKQAARQVALGQLLLLNRTVRPICSIEVSPHGDLLDEQKGSAAGRAAQGRAGRTPHECARSEGAGVERMAVPTTEEALPGGGRPRPAPRLAGRPGNRHLAQPARAQIATLMTTTYAGFNDVHLTEKLLFRAF